MLPCVKFAQEEKEESLFVLFGRLFASNIWRVKHDCLLLLLGGPHAVNSDLAQTSSKDVKLVPGPSGSSMECLQETCSRCKGNVEITSVPERVKWIFNIGSRGSWFPDNGRNPISPLLLCRFHDPRPLTKILEMKTHGLVLPILLSRPLYHLDTSLCDGLQAKVVSTSKCSSK
jgi:hypothetical protein